jgi:hypothetical protein
MGPGDEIAVIELEVGPGVKGADRRADQQDADHAVDEEKTFVDQAAEDVPRVLSRTRS